MRFPLAAPSSSLSPPWDQGGVVVPRSSGRLQTSHHASPVRTPHPHMAEFRPQETGQGQRHGRVSLAETQPRRQGEKEPAGERQGRGWPTKRPRLLSC